MKQRLDQELVNRGIVPTRSQAESYIRLSKVVVNTKIITKSGTFVNENDSIKLLAEEQYVSRAGLKLASVAKLLDLDFKDKTVLDVGSSTGGFTDYALKHSAKKVIAVDVGTDQLHPSLRGNEKIELHEKTDIRDFQTNEKIDLAVADVSFISLREILPSVSKILTNDSQLVAMAKPQFESAHSGQKHKGVIKNDAMRRKILQDFETWAKGYFVIIDKQDSEITGSKGN
ncbi:MAG: TlyA family RNA methyltransferase, partial [Acidobacteriota bacterium]